MTPAQGKAIAARLGLEFYYAPSLRAWALYAVECGQPATYFPPATLRACPVERFEAIAGDYVTTDYTAKG